MRDIRQLHPELQKKIRQLQELCEAEGLELGIGECLRTVEEQDALYAQGRTTPGNIVTYARGSSYSSQHQWGIAFDFYHNVPGRAYEPDSFFRRVGDLAKRLGLAWGGDWDSPVDMPHVYLPYWGDTPAALKRQYTMPTRFFASWPRDTDPDHEKRKPLEVDGWMGPATVTRLQQLFGTTVDGIISDQWIWYKDQNPGLIAVEWVNYGDNDARHHGSELVRAMQKYFGAVVDGVIGPDTISRMQEFFGTTVDGCVSGPSQLVMAMQSWANTK